MNIAIVGATGNVGRKLIEILEKRNFEISELYLVASSRSEGKKINFLSIIFILLFYKRFKVHQELELHLLLL